MEKVHCAYVIGSLIYIMVCTKLDIVYVVRVISRFISNIGKQHCEAIKWILRNLRGSTNHVYIS